MDNGNNTEESVVSIAPSPGNVDDMVLKDKFQSTLTFSIHVLNEIRRKIVNIVEIFLLLVFWITAALFLPFWRAVSTWKLVFIVSCVAVSIDCLFLYIPIIDQDHTCIKFDNKLRNVALVLRSITDVLFISHIFLKIIFETNLNTGFPKYYGRELKSRWFMIYPRKVMAEERRYLSVNTIVNFLALLPIPQVAILVGLYNLGSSNYVIKQTILNIFLILQYILRTFQIFLSLEKLGQKIGKLTKGSFYFILYIIASHVFAAFWYFFSIQRVISCWNKACQETDKSTPSYICGRSLLNTTSLSKLCSLDSSNVIFFDFGMFLNILQSGNASSAKFSTKFFYFFWWGLKNLSNFGTNLETSNYVWENCFAIFICVIGLLLFVFLIGNVQTYIQSESEKYVKFIDSINTKSQKKYEDLKKWMSGHDLPDEIMSYTMDNIIHDLVVEFIDEEVGACFLDKCNIKKYKNSKEPNDLDPLEFICSKSLKRIPIVRKLDAKLLRRFFRFSPKIIKREVHDVITRAGEETDSMYLIIEGVVEYNDAETTSKKTLSRYDCVGEELLHWAILNNSCSRESERLPTSRVTVKCQTPIEAILFSEDDLCTVFFELNNETLARQARSYAAVQRIKDWLSRNLFPEDLKENILECVHKRKLTLKGNKNVDVGYAFLLYLLPKHFEPIIKHHLSITALKRVPMLQKVYEYVLESISNFMVIVAYKENDYIVRAGEPLVMIFILRGRAILSDTTSSNTTTTRSTEISQITETNDDENVVDTIDSYYGEQLLSWASANNFSSAESPVLATRDVKCQDEVEAFILNAEDLKTVATKYGSQWNSITTIKHDHLVGKAKDAVADTGNSTSTEIEETSIRLHQGQDMLLEQLVLLRETMFQCRDDMVRRLDQMAAFLATSGYNDTSPAPAAAP